MKLTKIFTTALILFATSASLAATKCDHKGGGSLFANTNPSAKAKVQGTQTASAKTQSGTR